MGKRTRGDFRVTRAPLSKVDIFREFHGRVGATMPAIRRLAASREEKARAVNQLVNDTRVKLIEEAGLADREDRQLGGVIIQYCYSVIGLEYRHQVWPYEYMAFSRRVGELWEQFCSAAWDYPSRAGVRRIDAPSFNDVKGALLTRIQGNVAGHKNSEVILSDVDVLFDIIGEINMREDEVFAVDGIPHVIDFKSGFGSNEKGNMLRLKTVGQAYRIWNHKTKLFLLVRQDANNNYLAVLRRMGLWSVHTGADAYSQISRLTGVDMQWVRENVIDWPRDVTTEFLSFLQRGDLMDYLTW
jgi:hypothetical protein